MRESKND